MTTERWRRIEDLFHAASERPPAERETFLAAQCAGDDALRREVESLLGQQEGTLLREGLAAAAARIAKRQPGELVGRALGDCVLGPLLGMGAMGDVYLARDSKLGRDVAVKILPGALGQHPERLARFRREAQILAALNHPNVAAIYGLEEGDGLTGLVLELVDGETLAERLRGGAGPGRRARALPTEDALTIARQVADGLQAAHRKGIVHRDLKPENIKLTTGGVVKVLDFGLAKVEGDALGPAVVPALATVDGVLLGTVAYMSPEQARGLPVDKRTDIWAFGCVLYEMLTGSRPFSGDSAADVLGMITGGEPDWTRLPSTTPGRVRRLLRRCLAKDPDQRLHDIADARIEIDDAIGGHEEDEAIESAGQLHAARRRWLVMWGVAAVVTVAAVGLSWFALSKAAPDQPQARLAIPIPPEISIYAIGRGSSVAVSPDGRLVVYVGLSRGRRQLFVRPLDRSEATPIQGSENATSPFFSPDGRWIGFIENAPAGSLKKIGVEGGTPVTVVDSQGVGLRGFAAASATWAPDDTIVFSSTNPKHRGLWRVAAGGGNPVQLTVPQKGELVHSWPQMVPGRNAVVYTIWSNSGFENGRIAIQPLDGGNRTILVEGASYGRIVATDRRRAWLVYARPQGLEAAPFDLERLQVAGSRVPVLDGVLVNLSGGAHFSVADSGLLAFVPGGLDELNKTLVRVAKDGRATEIGMIPGLGFQYRVSPDGLHLVMAGATGPSRDVWIQDLVTRSTPRRLTFGGIHNMPIWTPDGRRIIYSSGESPRNIFWMTADQSGVQERLTTSANDQYPGSVSRDGSLLAYVEDHADRGSDIWVLRLQDPGQRRLVVGTPAGEQRPVISPDGRWMAYQSNMTGDRFEIYLASLTGGPLNVPVSTGGGRNALWSRDGRELYYRTATPESATGDMIAVSIDTSGSEPKVGAPRALFRASYQGDGDLTPDGDFLLLKPTPQESPARVIQLVFNWFAYLNEKVPRR